DPPGLLYVATRRDTTAYAEALTARGIRALAYHGGLRAAVRGEVHDAWHTGGTDVVVATSAFGMGIDKPDVRVVVHAATPDSPDTYYQEIGRAGRDGEPANAVLFHRPEDLALHRFHAGGGADEQRLAAVWRVVRKAGRGGIRMTDLRRAVDVGPRRVTAVVDLLERVGAVRSTHSRVQLLERMPRAEVLRRAAEEVDRHRRVRETRTAMMRQYAETRGCRRQFLLGYLGEQLGEPCGRCDTCDDGSARRVAEEREQNGGDVPFPAGTEVAHQEFGDGVVMGVEPDRVTVLFDDEGYRTLALDAVLDDELMTERPA
ncbi:MAG: helicase-related protein, partial [Phycicoccus sp.]